jgi:hypothetical protein
MGGNGTKELSKAIKLDGGAAGAGQRARSGRQSSADSLAAARPELDTPGFNLGLSVKMAAPSDLLLRCRNSNP